MSGARGRGRDRLQRGRKYFWSDVNALYHDCYNSYTTAYITQSLPVCTLTIGEFMVCKLYLNKSDKKN